MAEAAKQQPYERRILVAIVVFGFALRLACGLLLPDQQIPDADNAYRPAAASFWTSGRFTVPNVMPLYPMLVAVTGPGWGQLLADILLSTALIWLVYRLTLAVFADRAAALLAALAAAVYPFFIFYSALGLTEPLFLALLVGAFVAWYRARFLLAAILAVLAILTRPTLDLVAPFLIVAFAVIVHHQPVGRALRHLAVYLIVYVALLSPWWLHNYAAYGTFVRLNLGSGTMLYDGNRPGNLTGGPLKQGFEEFDHIREPLARDRAMWEAGKRYILEHPDRFIAGMGRKFLRFWRPWPYAQEYAGWSYLIISAASYVPVLILSLMYLAAWGWREIRGITPILLFAAYLTAIHLVFLGSLRYRLPIEPFMIVFAAVAAARLARRFAPGRLLLERLTGEPATGAASLAAR
jgi:4-amino-4-deoxy-L-arabinose transferase-like glycosyltransferase